MKKIYISGPITGTRDYKKRFAAAADHLTRMGHLPLHSAILPQGFEHAEYLRICEVMIDICDAICLLPGWEKSIGARLEKECAEKWGKEIIYLDDIPADKPLPRGEYGYVRLTDAEYEKIITDLGPEETARCIRYVDESAETTHNKNKWKNWNLVLRKCAREGWGLTHKKPGRMDHLMSLMEADDDAQRNRNTLYGNRGLISP